MPVLFLLAVQNYDLFAGKRLKNKEKEVELEGGSLVCVLQVDTVQVEEETMLVNYMQPGEELTLVYLFTA